MDKRLIRLRHYQNICGLHLRRLTEALKAIKPLIPIGVESYNSLKNDELALIDQMSYRFGKLQDTSGQLIKAILIVIGEDIRDIPFIDILNKAERLGVITSAEEWLLMREQRNMLTHEYSIDERDITEGINRLYELSVRLCEIYSTIEQYCLKRHLL